MIEVRRGPSGWIAQLLPPDVIGDEARAQGRRWLCMSWPDGNLTAELFTDDQVADWRMIYHDESTSTDPRRPQRKDEVAPLSHDLAPDERQRP